MSNNGSDSSAGSVVNIVDSDVGYYETYQEIPSLWEPLKSRREAFHTNLRTTLMLLNPDYHLSLMVIDLDNFRAVNKVIGHIAADHLLSQIEWRLRELSDQGYRSYYLGGDEFAVFVQTKEATETGIDLVAPILEVINGTYEVGEENVFLQGSTGIANFPQHAQDSEELFHLAESSMYSAKEVGSDFYLYEKKSYSDANPNKELEWQLRRAIVMSQLELYFQPKVSLGSGEYTGVEALVRWRHPERGLLQPDSFVPIAEQSGLMRQMTRWVLNSALRQCGSWKKAGLHAPVSVNLTGGDLSDPGLVGYIADVLEAWDLGGESLELEITESSAIENYETCKFTLKHLSDMGISIAVDDFGTGYSSMTHLRRLPVDTIKIDKSFVFGMDGENQESHIVKAITELGHSLGKKIVAEGVESELNWDRLAGAGCDQAQGYLISQPLNNVDATDWLWQMEREKITSAQSH